MQAVSGETGRSGSEKGSSTTMTHNDIEEDCVRSAIKRHVTSFWPNSALDEESWALGPIQETVPGSRVLRLISGTVRKPVVYVTSGCFAVESGMHIRHEFVITSPCEEHRHVETLSMLVNFHADKRFQLDIGSVVNIGDSWMPGSNLDHLLISLP